MRSYALQKIASLVPRLGKCHRPFVPLREGSYLLQLCHFCGQGVPIGEKVQGSSVYVVEVKNKFGLKENS